jgi:hypothetical protein
LTCLAEKNLALLITNKWMMERVDKLIILTKSGNATMLQMNVLANSVSTSKNGFTIL